MRTFTSFAYADSVQRFTAIAHRQTAKRVFHDGEGCDMAREWWLEPSEPEQPICPECGEECEIIYLNSKGDVVGCDRCVVEKDAYDWMDEMREARECEKGSYYRDE